MKKILSKEEIDSLVKEPTRRNRLYLFEINGEIYAENLSEATDVVMKMSDGKKDCLRMKYVAIKG